MGIQGLIPFLKNATSPSNIKDFRGCTVAVDSYCWLHRGAFACAEKLAVGEKTDQYVHYCMKYVNSLLSFGIKPIMVFDGCRLPSKKDVEKTRRERRDLNRKKAAHLLLEGKRAEARDCLSKSIDITPQMALDLMQACRAKGVDCIVAPYEADAQLAYLAQMGVVQIVVTEDSDLVLFGCERIMFKMDFAGNGLLYRRCDLSLTLGPHPEHFTFDKFRYMCILSGCDYLASLPGIGLGKAAKVFRLSRQEDMALVLKRLPQTLNMSSLVVTHEYVDGFFRADACFLHQLVFDPLQRRLVPLSPYPPGRDPREFHYAGPTMSDERALQIALGNININTGEVIADFDPDTHVYKTTSWDAGAGATQTQSIWSRGYKPSPCPPSLLPAAALPGNLPSTKGKEVIVKATTLKAKVAKRARQEEDELPTDDLLSQLYAPPTDPPPGGRAPGVKNPLDSFSFKRSRSSIDSCLDQLFPKTEPVSPPDISSGISTKQISNFRESSTGWKSQSENGNLSSSECDREKCSGTGGPNLTVRPSIVGSLGNDAQYVAGRQLELEVDIQQLGMSVAPARLAELSPSKVNIAASASSVAKLNDLAPSVTRVKGKENDRDRSGRASEDSLRASEGSLRAGGGVLGASDAGEKCERDVLLSPERKRNVFTVSGGGAGSAFKFRLNAPKKAGSPASSGVGSEVVKSRFFTAGNPLKETTFFKELKKEHIESPPKNFAISDDERSDCDPRDLPNDDDLDASDTNLSIMETTKVRPTSNFNFTRLAAFRSSWDKQGGDEVSSKSVSKKGGDQGIIGSQGRASDGGNDDAATILNRRLFGSSVPTARNCSDLANHRSGHTSVSSHAGLVIRPSDGTCRPGFASGVKPVDRPFKPVSAFAFVKRSEPRLGPSDDQQKSLVSSGTSRRSLDPATLLESPTACILDDSFASRVEEDLEATPGSSTDVTRSVLLDATPSLDDMEATPPDVQSMPWEENETLEEDPLAGIVLSKPQALSREGGISQRHVGMEEKPMKGGTLRALGLSGQSFSLGCSGGSGPPGGSLAGQRFSLDALLGPEKLCRGPADLEAKASVDLTRSKSVADPRTQGCRTSGLSKKAKVKASRDTSKDSGQSAISTFFKTSLACDRRSVDKMTGVKDSAPL